MRDCLARTVDFAEEVLIKCPYRDDEYSCQSYLQQREIKALVSSEIYERYLQRSIITAESIAEKSFHCKTPDCPGWCMFEDNINVFHCPVCLHYNCLNCRAMHEGLNCRQYQDKLKSEKKLDPDSEKTLQFLNKMIESGKALRCPKCDLILMKKWGCDWLKCAVCLTEICWITKGPRWGPAGQGDTSGGCRCGVNGVKCHPSCTYCH
ncbi:ranBP-type and C3HC4-type zinc finger-containing protein 1 [Trichonephila clavipes]|uniref:RanBP-type and C3HC4-type zinc finger-containing protein 1 n=1 Tax=Trichonephila clavipes TaxID=2585209 RepID=A0A8X6RK49_TRICX|nr:ranBP-type and C3HC4-type zinc finger-containing protein 1 [Trichonephila clavipes]